MFWVGGPGLALTGWKGIMGQSLGLGLVIYSVSSAGGRSGQSGGTAVSIVVECSGVQLWGQCRC